ncbi:hypothetical protein J5N97_001153 [Dioscorea zingiberensis]|uniref:RRM domain-containing protein n=1 Tax=Dioscorea zingiberensis TaxID=325984 RepID=A0A9D5BUN1_9LILI|nr:hypothetical protein J5N97_001153 [Dioscorea zingiberensis]
MPVSSSSSSHVTSSSTSSPRPCVAATSPEAVESLRDPVRRKVFVRGLDCETSADGLRSLFSQYGDVENATVIFDKETGRSKGYGFVTFRHADGTLLALKEPSKKVGSRMAVTVLAAIGAGGGTAVRDPSSADVSQHKI